MTLPLIDTHEFTRRGDSAAGREQVTGLQRLGSLLASPDGTLDWRLAGRSELGSDGSRRAYLRLECQAVLQLRCVRCLESVAVPIELARDYRLVASEEQAQAEDPDDDDFDLLVSSRRFDLAGLLEDEAIMALPAAPRHADCQAPAAPSEAAGSRAALPRENPFAALGALRAAGGPNEGDEPPVSGSRTPRGRQR